MILDLREKLIGLLAKKAPESWQRGDLEDIAYHLLVHGVTIMEPGEWIDMQDDDFTEGMWRCSKCGYDGYFDIATPIECEFYFCPHCGAPMKGETNGCERKAD